jgi:hypothetical protein
MNKKNINSEQEFLNLTEQEIIIIFLQKKYNFLVSKIEEFNNIMNQNIIIDKRISENIHKYNNSNIKSNNIIHFANLIQKNISLFEIQIQKYEI